MAILKWEGGWIFDKNSIQYAQIYTKRNWQKVDWFVTFFENVLKMCVGGGGNYKMILGVKTVKWPSTISDFWDGREKTLTSIKKP